MLVENIWRGVQKLIKEEIEVEDFVIGAKCSYVIVSGKEGRAMGTAYLPSEDITPGYSRVPSLENLEVMLTSTNIMEKSLGVALLNAISQYLLWNLNMYKNFKVEYKNILEFFSAKNMQNTVIIGNMMPLVKKFKDRGVNPIVLERHPKQRYNALPDCFASRVIPSARNVVITGAALVNDTIDYILSLLKNVENAVLVGPTSAIYPVDNLISFTHIGSLRIEDIDRAAKIIKLGGGRWDFSKYAREYVITLKG